MKIFVIWVASFLLAGIIISPFFWLKFLKKWGVGKYLVASSVVTLGFLGWFISVGYGLFANMTARKSADLYYWYYEVGFNAIMLTHLLIMFAPFIFTKIIYDRINAKHFWISLGLTGLIFVSYVYVFVYILLPWAFAGLSDHF